MNNVYCFIKDILKWNWLFIIINIIIINLST